MPEPSSLREAKQALLERYLRGDVQPTRAEEDRIPRRAAAGPAPLSFAQEQMWLLSQMIPTVPIYNDCCALHLPGPLDVPALERSLNELMRRHEILRTSFSVVDEQPVQHIHPPMPVPLPVIDLRNLPANEREAEALRLGREEVNQLFDLAEAPLWRARLLRLEDEEHRLFLITHHLIMDGVSSYEVFLPELNALYQAFAAELPSPLPEPPLQYADYAVWQRQQWPEAKLAEHLAYWKQQLDPAPDPLELPVDRLRPPHRSYRGSLQTFALSKPLTEAFRELSRKEGVTLFITLVAAFNTLLSRYCGQEEIVIGAVTAGRPPAVQGLVGCFVNPFALRLDLSGAPSFRALLPRVRERLSAALDHAEAPFEYLVKELRPERSLEQPPFFQVMMALEPVLPPLPSGWSVSQMEVAADAAKYDLYLELDDRPEGLIGRFEYNTDLFAAATIQRMVGHWRTLLEGIVVDPDQPITTLPLLAEAERQQALVEWNATRADYPADQGVHQRFEHQAVQHPEAVAVVYDGASLTYQELNARANQLAFFLQQRGVGPDVLVGLYLDRSLNLLVGLLGILKSGGAYVPLDPSYPTERLAFMLEDSQAAVLLTQQRLLTQLPAQNARVICLDGQWAEIAQEPTTNPVSAVQADNLAYVIYTSGSTGTPKGVMITHRGLSNLAEAEVRAFHLGPESRVLQLASFSFDASVWDILMAFSAGGALYLATEEQRVPGPALIAFLQEQAITVATLTPSIWAALPAAHLPALQTVISAAEACSPDLVTAWAGGRHFFNAYGPTEITVCASLSECFDGSRTPPIGRPLPNMTAYILSPHLRLVPIGVPGELYIGGVGLARGYLNRPDLTAERFIPHPFDPTPGARLYKTGDLARYLPSGEIEFIGRSDQQVKLRGFRIELGEIEAVLRQHRGVREAVVIAREDTPGDKRLVAYLVAAAEEMPSWGTLRGFVQERLPAYMLPDHFVFLEALPQSPNGKLDRQALPTPEAVGLAASAEVAPPRTPTEARLAGIFADVLGLPQVGVRTNFFEMGGHSLLGVRVLARVRDAFQVELPLSSLFQQSTVEELAAEIERLIRASMELLSEEEARRLLG